MKRADVLAHAGFFADALATLDAIPRDSPQARHTRAVLLNLLRHLPVPELSTPTSTRPPWATSADAPLRRLLRAVTDTASFNHVVFVMIERARNGRADSAATVLKRCLDEYRPGTRDFSIMASNLAYIYKLSAPPTTTSATLCSAPYPT